MEKLFEFMPKKELEELFKKASKIKKTDYYTPHGLDQMQYFDGVKRFKRKVLGLCGKEAVRSLEEMAQALYDINAVSSMEEGKKIAPQLAGTEPAYGDSYLEIVKVQNLRQQEGYRIRQKLKSLQE